MILEAALQYARAGLPVFPVHWMKDGQCSCHLGSACEHKAKHPITRHGLKDATTDEEAIRQFWALHPEANVACVVPKGYAVIDIDPRNGGDVTWSVLEKEYGELETLTALTGGGGQHLWVKTDGALESPGLGIDIKQGGSGYVLMSPSVHESGNSYEWLDGFNFAPVDAPPWLGVKAPRVERENNEINTIAIGEETIRQVAELLSARWVDGRQDWALPFFGYLVSCGWAVDARLALVHLLGGDKLQKYEDIAVRAISMDGPGQVALAWPEWSKIEAAARRPLDSFIAESFAVAVPVKPVPGFSFFGSCKPRAVQFVIKELELGGDVRPGLLTGLPNGGKTPLCLHLALCVVFGKPFLGFVPEKRGSVCLVFFEGSQNLVLIRLLRLARGMGIADADLEAAYKDGTLTLLYTDGGPLTGPTEAEALLALCQEKKFVLGVVDTLTSALDNGVDINTPQARGPLNVLSKITELTGVPWIMTAHTPKTGDAIFKTLGSTAIVGAADTIHSLERNGDKTQFTLTHERSIVNAASPVAFHFVDIGELDIELGASFGLGLSVVDKAESIENEQERAIQEDRKKRAIKNAVREDAIKEAVAQSSERVFSLVDVPRTNTDIGRMINLTPKLLKMVLDKLISDKRLTYSNGKFQRADYNEESFDDLL